MELSTVAIIGRVVSQPFLVCTFFHYWQATNFRYLYRMCFMNYLVSLMISNTWSIWAIYNNFHKTRPDYILLIYNFIELSILLWTNVLCFSFWQSIRNLLPYSYSREEKITYIKCLIYVWSLALLYTIIGIINYYLLQSKRQIFKAVNWFLFIFQVIILFSNVLMVVHSTVIIIKEMKAIKNMRAPDAIINKDNNKKKQILYNKLFVVTIILLCSKWMWARLDNILKSKVAFDIFECLMVGNAFQGLFIYLMFAFKKKKIRALKTRMSKLFTEQTTLCALNTDESITNGEQISKFDFKKNDSNNVLEPLENCNHLDN